MIDEHTINIANIENWGIRPVLFNIFGIDISSYSFFLLLAIIVGGFVYFKEAKKEKKDNEKTFFIAIGALIGGTLGAKIPMWIMNYDLIIQNWGNLHYILSGRTITGALIGGPIGVFITKKILNIKAKRGNLFAPALAIGDSIGRIGCFLKGCCAGKATNIASYGVDFGDGILRHPTQLYESFFTLSLFFYLMHLKKTKKDLKDGELFYIFITSYFTFRFFIEFIRTEQELIWGLSVFQGIAICVLIFYNKHKIINLIKNFKTKTL